MLTDEDLENVRPASTRVINFVQFADESAIEPIYVDRAPYLAPDGLAPFDELRASQAGRRDAARGRQASATRRVVKRIPD